MPLTIRATGPADEGVVWRRYVTPELWSSWAPQIRSVGCGDDVIARGSTGVVRAWPAGSVGFVVDAVDPVARTWSWRVGPGRLVRMDHGVVDGPDGTTAWARIHLPAPVVLPYLPLAQVALRRLVRT